MIYWRLIMVVQLRSWLMIDEDSLMMVCTVHFNGQKRIRMDVSEVWSWSPHLFNTRFLQIPGTVKRNGPQFFSQRPGAAPGTRGRLRGVEWGKANNLEK